MLIRHFVIAFAALSLFSFANAKTPWEEFIDLPTPEHARAVNAMFLSGNPTEDESFSTNERGLMLLDAQVRAFDEEAIECAFRLLASADGAYGEMLSESLGSLIRPNPKLFLKHYSRHQQSIDRLDALVGNFGANYIDSYDAMVYESKMRIKALQSVTDRSLRGARDRCIAALSTHGKK
jgi:hypothetical protein